MSTAFDWAPYDYCETCDQTAGNPCFDLRYAREAGTFHRDRPHRGRPRRRAVAPAVLWLVEEHTLEMGYGPETISFHAVVPAGSAREAFTAAGRQRNPSGDGFSFLFGPGELDEVVPGYLWQAADGSSVAYEVRKLGNLPQSA